MRTRRLAGVVAAAALLLGSMGTAAVAAPSNDEVIGATPVTGLPFSVTQDLGEATAGVFDPGLSCLTGPAEATVWFTYTPAVGGTVQFDTLLSPTDTDTVLAVYLGGATESSEVACNDDVDVYTPIRQSLVTVDVVADQMYTIMLGVYPGRPAGTVTLRAVAPPDNDEIAGATPITELPFSVTQDLSQATVGLHDPTPSCMPAAAEATVWFTYTPAVDGTVRFDTLLSTTDTVLAVYRGGATLAGEVACNDDVDVDPPISQSLVTVDVVAGETYTVMLGVYPGWPAGTVTLRAVVPPDNDEIAGATTIPELPFSVTQDLSQATVGPDDPTPSCMPAAAEATVWFTYTPAVDGTVRFDTLLSSTDTVLAVYRGDVTLAGQVACNDDVDVDPPISQSLVTVDVVAGEMYTVMLGVYPGWPAGEVTLRADLVSPPNEMTVSIDSRGTVVPTSGEATIRGTVTCSQPTTVSLDGGLSQRRGRTVVDGSGLGEVQCDGATPWELTITGADGLFRRGRAEAHVSAYSSDDPDVTAFVEQTVRLSAAKAEG